MEFPLSFMWPEVLISLLVIPLFISGYLLLQRRRQRLTERYSNLGFIQGKTKAESGYRRHIPIFLLLSGLTILIVALARPQMEVSLPRIEGTIILAFDVSGSMAADDLKPTRMEAAKTAAREFVLSQPPSVQIGIVAFSESGLAVQPPSNDQDATIAAINRLTPQRGTSVAHGILASLNILFADSNKPSPPSNENQETPSIEETYASAAIVLLSDGENTAPPEPYEAAQTAADHGIRIYTIGIGTAAGTTLNVNGFTIFTQLDEGSLQEIALLTGGSFFNAENEEDLQKIYANITPQLVIKPEKLEVTGIFTVASILIFLIGCTFSLLWYNRLP